MKCLSLWNPWASLLAHGKKQVETRGWEMRHRGPLLIHATKKWTGALQELCLTPPFRSALAAFGVPPAGHSWTVADIEARKRAWGMPLGAIVGRVNVIACYPTERVGCVADDHATPPMTMPGGKMYVGETERAFGDYSAGRFAFLCTDFVAFEKPLPYSGAQGLFDVPDELLKGLK